ncbi:MAG: CHAD domain-containing protein [Chitinophagaceae bacterium]|nr:CHAD domain-containing protein [Chitinophagaceae bacterium]
MEQERMDAVIRQQYEKCVQLGRALAEGFGMEDIHDFRVETKRFRALLRLTAVAGHSPIKPKLPNNLKVYYAMTGELRNIQLQKKALEDAAVRLHLGPPAKCLAVLDDRIGMTEHMIKLYLGASNPLGREKTQWHDHISAHAADAANEAFIAGKIKTFTLPGGGDLPDNEQLHTIRKAMKDLLYAWPYFSKENIERAIPKGLPSRKHLETCARELGDLHDIIVQLSLLKDRNFLLCTCPQSARFLESAEQLWCRDKQVLLEKIKGLLLQYEPHVG